MFATVRIICRYMWLLLRSAFTVTMVTNTTLMKVDHHLFTQLL